MSKPGRKRFTTDPSAFLESKNPLTFAPSRMTREELVYCMQETGVYNKSAVLSAAIRHYYDFLQAEAIRRSEMN